MKAREYCCCAIPIMNAGIYAALVEQLVVALALGLISITTPRIVGAATPSFAALIFAIVCFVAAGVQVLGFIGVARESHIMFRRYLSLHSIATIAAFAIGATWTAISATRHAQAKTKCISDFYDVTDDAQKSQSDVLCEIFPWVDVGIMGGVWVLLAIMQIYLFVIMSSYSKNQVKDRSEYDALPASNSGERIPMNTWEQSANPSGAYRDHGRKESAASMSDIMGQPMPKARDPYADNYNYEPYNPTPPSGAYTTEPQPTPHFNDTAYHGGPAYGLSEPGQSRPHPGAF